MRTVEAAMRVLMRGMLGKLGLTECNLLCNAVWKFL